MQTQPLKDFFFNPHDFFMHLVGSCIGRFRKGKHFHLAELMHAINATCCLTVCAGFGTETMRQTGNFIRQGLTVHDLILHGAPQCNLCGCHQTEIRILDGINLGFVSPRIKADPFQNLFAGQVGCAVKHEAFLHQFLHRILTECHLQQYRFIFQIIKAMTGDPCSCFEINQVMLLCQSHMIEGREFKRGFLAPHPHNGICLVFFSHRHIRVSQVGHACLLTLQQRFDFA